MKCEQCGKEMTEAKRWWGDNAYYGVFEHILYECENGHEYESKHDVPEALLPWMADYDEPDPELELEAAWNSCGITEDHNWCKWLGSDDCDMCPYHKWIKFESEQE